MKKYSICCCCCSYNDVSFSSCYLIFLIVIGSLGVISNLINIRKPLFYLTLIVAVLELIIASICYHKLRVTRRVNHTILRCFSIYKLITTILSYIAMVIIIILFSFLSNQIGRFLDLTFSDQINQFNIVNSNWNINIDGAFSAIFRNFFIFIIIFVIIPAAIIVFYFGLLSINFFLACKNAGKIDVDHKNNKIELNGLKKNNSEEENNL